MRRFIRTILATVTLALTMGFVPGADSGANAGTVGAELGDTMNGYDLLIAPTVPTGAPRIDQTFVDVAGKRENALSLMSRACIW